MNAMFRRALSPVLIGSIVFAPFVALPAAASPTVRRAPAASAVMGPLWYPCFLAGGFTALIGCAQTLFEP